MTTSLLKSPGLFSVFWPFSIMLSFGWSPLGRQLPNNNNNNNKKKKKKKKKKKAIRMKSNDGEKLSRWNQGNQTVVQKKKKMKRKRKLRNEQL